MLNICTKCGYVQRELVCLLLPASSVNNNNNTCDFIYISLSCDYLIWICHQNPSIKKTTFFFVFSYININKLKIICTYLELYQYLYRKDSHASQNFRWKTGFNTKSVSIILKPNQNCHLVYFIFVLLYLKKIY
jgi:hypothetical protein